MVQFQDRTKTSKQIDADSAAEGEQGQTSQIPEEKNGKLKLLYYLLYDLSHGLYYGMKLAVAYRVQLTIAYRVVHREPSPQQRRESRAEEQSRPMVPYGER